MGMESDILEIEGIMSNRFSFTYKFSVGDSQRFIDFTSQVDSQKTTITHSLCTNNFTSSVDEASFTLPETPLFVNGLATPKKQLIDALLGNEDVMVIIESTKEVVFRGYADRSSINLTSYPLPPNLKVKVQDISVLHLDDKVNKNLVYEKKTIKTIVRSLLEEAGYNATHASLSDEDTHVMPEEDNEILEAFAIDSEESKTYREYIDTLLFEAGGYVLDFGSDGRIKLVHLAWDAKTPIMKVIDNPMNSNGISMKSKYLKEDGVKVIWSSLKWSGQGQRIWQSDISRDWDENQLLGETVESHQYWPEDGDLNPSYMEYDAKLLDKGYLWKQNRRENSELDIIMAKDVYARMDSTYADGTPAKENAWAYIDPKTWKFAEDDKTAFEHYGLETDPQIWPKKAWYLIYNSTDKPLNLMFFTLYGDVLYRDHLNTVSIKDAKNPKEYESTYIYNEKHATRFAKFWWQFLRTSRYEYSWSEPTKDVGLNDVVAIGMKGMGNKQKAIIVSSTTKYINGNVAITDYNAVAVSEFMDINVESSTKVPGTTTEPSLTWFIATLSRYTIECFSNRTPRDRTPIRFRVQINNLATIPRLTVAGKVVEMQRDSDGSWIYDIDANLDGYDTCKLTLVVGNRTSEYIISKLVKNDSIPPDIVVPEGWKEVLQFAYGSADGILLTGYVEDKDAIVTDSEGELADVGWTDAVDGECPLRPVNDYFIWQRQGVYDPESKESPSDWTLSLYDTPYYRFDFTLSQSTYSFDTRADESEVNEIHIKPNIVAFEASALVVSATFKDGIDENGSPKIQTKQLQFDKINQEYLLTVPIKTAPIDSIIINAKLGVLSWQAILLPEDITEYGHYYGIVEIDTKTEDDKEVDDLGSIKDNPVFSNPLPTYRDGRPKDYFTSKNTGITYEYQADGKWETCDDASRLIEGLKGLIDENIDLNQISDANTVAFFRQIVAQKIYAEQIKVMEGFFDRIEVSGDSRLLGQLENDAITTFPASTQDIKAKADFVQLSILSLEPLEVMRVGTPQKKYYAWGLKKADLGKAFDRGGIFGDKDYARTRFEGTVRLDGETYTATNTDPFIVSWHPDASQPTLSIEGGGIPKKTAYVWGAEDNYSNYIWNNAYIIFRPSTDEIPSVGKLESIDVRAWDTTGGFYTQKILPRASGGQVGEDQERFLKGYFEELFATSFHGSVEGNIKGDVTGNLTGNVTGDVKGNVNGNVTGNVTGDTKGLHTGDVKGNVSGNVTGNVTGDVTGNVNAEGTKYFVWGAVFN